MPVYRTIFILLIIHLFSACHDRQQSKSHPIDGVTGTLHIDEYRVKKGSDLKGWTCYKLKHEKLCCPSEWKSVKEDQTFFTAYIDPSDTLSYLNVTKYQPVFVDSTYTSYFRGIYKMMSNNKDEIWEDPILQRYVYDDKTSYTLEFRSTINNKRYITFVGVFDRDGSTYEFAMKFHEEQMDKYKETFGDMLYLFQVNGKLVFNKDEKLLEIQQIDISKV